MKKMLLLVAAALALTACSLPASEIPTAQEEGAKAAVLYDFECYTGNTRTTYVRNSTIKATYFSTGQVWELRDDSMNPHQEEEVFYYRQREGEMCGSRRVLLPLPATGDHSSSESTPTAK